MSVTDEAIDTLVADFGYSIEDAQRALINIRSIDTVKVWYGPYYKEITVCGSDDLRFTAVARYTK